MRVGTDSFLICNSSFLQPQTQKNVGATKYAPSHSNEAAAAAQRARQASMAKLWEAA